MAATVERREVPVDAVALWAVITDFSAHGQWFPGTSIRCDGGPPGEGWSFTGRSRLGPVWVDDVMVITRWQPPHELALIKVGRWIRGGARITVDDTDGGSLLTWREWLTVRPAPGTLTEPVLARVVPRLLRQVVDHALADPRLQVPTGGTGTGGTGTGGTGTGAAATGGAR